MGTAGDGFDLSNLTFDEFVTLLFDHDPETEEHWYQDANLGTFDDFSDVGVKSPEIVVAHMTRLFATFCEWASKFSLPQINVGIWAIFSHGGFRVQKHLWLPSVPLEQRLECIRSMYLVYSGYVSKSTVAVMENCFDMWWDLVANSFWGQMQFDHHIDEGDVGSLEEDQKALLETLFDTLLRILELPDPRTQGYALHGLGHLHHPNVRQVVQRFLDQHRHEFTTDGIEWVEKCRDGVVM